MEIGPLVKRRWVKSLLILSFWIVAGTLFTVQSYFYRKNVGSEITWWELYPGEVSYFILWALFTPLVLWLSYRLPIERNNWIIRTTKHIFIGIVVAVIHRMIYTYLRLNATATIENPFTWQKFSNEVLGFFDYGVFIYFIVLFVSQVITYSRNLFEEQVKGSKLKEELAVAQLQTLKMQLHPHFLFNTLNTISVLIKDEPDIAEKMIDLLSDLLRKTLQYANSNEIPLEEEIGFLKNYLQIEQTRFRDRLTVTMNIDRETTEGYVPALILQPLVENAINHGIAKRRGAGLLEITSKRQDGELMLAVRDDGYGIDNDSREPQTEGIGLTNTRTRLQTLYGDHQKMKLSRVEAGGTIVEIVLPFHSAPL